MKLKFPFNDIRINRISLPFTPITPGIAYQFQCSSSAGVRIQINRNRNNLSSVHRRFSPLCSLSQSYNGQSVDQVQAPQRTLHDSFLQVVLVSPQIPGNVGSIARTCAASAVGLHLVEPLGFTVDNSKLKRAGLDYWPYVVVKVHRSWLEFRDYFLLQEGEKRLLALTKRGAKVHSVTWEKEGERQATDFWARSTDEEDDLQQQRTQNHSQSPQQFGIEQRQADDGEEIEVQYKDSLPDIETVALGSTSDLIQPQLISDDDEDFIDVPDHFAPPSPPLPQHPHMPSFENSVPASAIPSYNGPSQCPVNGVLRGLGLNLRGVLHSRPGNRGSRFFWT